MAYEINAPNYSHWEKHFKDMVHGKVHSNGRIYVVNKQDMSGGSGIQLVSPAQQIDAMAEAKLKKAIKRKKPASKAHSVKKRAKGKTSCTKTKKQKTYRR